MQNHIYRGVQHDAKSQQNNQVILTVLTEVFHLSKLILQELLGKMLK